VPDEGPAAPGARLEATLRAAEEFIQGQDTAVQAKLGALLKVFESGAVFRYCRRFSRLSARLDAYLRAWRRSPVQRLRFGFSGLRNLILLTFCTQPEHGA
jgi:hypothetical protein